MTAPIAPSKAPESVSSAIQSHVASPDEKNSGIAPSAAPQPKAQARSAAQSQNGGDVKLSGAELKKRAKAEKQARRAAEKTVREGGSNDAATQSNVPPKKSGEPKTPSGGGRRASQTDDTRHHPPKQNAVPSQAQKGHPSRSSKSNSSSQRQQSQGESKKVALFGHLYSQPRRISIAGAGKEIHPAVLALGLQMSNYVVCGSNARCVATLLVFKKVIESYTTPPGTTLTRHLTSHLSPQIDHLKSCRPLSISMGNAIRSLKLDISTIDIDTPDSESKSYLCDQIDKFIQERITLAGTVITNTAASKIQDGDVVLVYSKSSVVQQTLLAARTNGTQFRVIVVDSKPLFEGKHMAATLAGAGIEVQYTLIHGVSHVVKDASKVFLGAHAMMSNGRLFSRIGTSIVAMVAREADVPVIVCCESVKFTDRVALDSIVNNELAPPDELVERAAISTSSTALADWRKTPNLQLLNLMYDITPAEYIKMVITEYGSLPPSSVPVVHRISTNT